MGRASRKQTAHISQREAALQDAGIARTSSGGPAEKALQGKGLLAEDWEIKIQEVDDQHHRWQVGEKSGFAHSASSASRAAHRAAAEEARQYAEKIAQQEKLYHERSILLQGLRLPEKIGYMETDILTDSRIENLRRQELPDGHTVLTYQIDRKHRRSPYPVIATEGVPQKEAGYLVFARGKALPLGSNSGSLPPKRRRGILSGWRKPLLRQAERELSQYYAREENLRLLADKETMRQEADHIWDYPEDRMS